MESFSDIVCDPGLQPAVKLIKYLQGCHVSSDTIFIVVRMKAQPEFDTVVNVRNAIIQ